MKIQQSKCSISIKGYVSMQEKRKVYYQVVIHRSAYVTGIIFLRLFWVLLVIMDLFLNISIDVFHLHTFNRINHYQFSSVLSLAIGPWAHPIMHKTPLLLPIPCCFSQTSHTPSVPLFQIFFPLPSWSSSSSSSATIHPSSDHNLCQCSFRCLMSVVRQLFS